MLFHTYTFAIFLTSVLFLFFVLPPRSLLVMLTLASYVFYGWVKPSYVILMLGSSVVDYSLAAYFVNRGARQRKLGITISAVFNFGMLLYFKYGNFAINNVQALLHSMGLEVQTHTLDVVLPLGISFYTFHTFSYVVDVLTGNFPLSKSPLKFILYVAWFPQLVAGPIARPENLLPEMDHLVARRFSMPERVPEAVTLFAEGWLRKAFADWLALTANGFFAGDIVHATSAQALWGIIAFGLQIYADFSGYTRMAQGVSWLFGIRLIENFNLPYLAKTPQDFWKRWHISLSSWFRDYLYIPLGGNRKGRYRTYFNLLATMLICGLWHGANWTFVIWGGIHGIYSVFGLIFRKPWEKLPRLVSIPIMWVLVFFAWIFFRAADLHTAVKCIQALGHGGWSAPPSTLGVAALGLFLCDLTVYCSKFSFSRIFKLTMSRAEVWASLALVLCIGVWAVNTLAGGKHVTTFIYFQF